MVPFLANFYKLTRVTQITYTYYYDVLTILPNCKKFCRNLLLILDLRL